MRPARQQQSSSSSSAAHCECAPIKDWVDEQARKQLNLEAVGCGKGSPVVNLRTGRPKAPLPAVLTKVKANKGWLPRAVADPAYSGNATLEDVYRYEQLVYVCLPHVSYCTGCSTVLLGCLVVQDLLCLA